MSIYFSSNAIRAKFEELAEMSLVDIAKAVVELEEEKQGLEDQVKELEDELADLEQADAQGQAS